MSWQERLFSELAKPRHSKILDYGVKAIACLVIAWGFVVCVLTISAVLIVILEDWFGL